jgi:hypothetical protein
MGFASLLFGVVVKMFPTSIVLGAFFWMVAIIVGLIAIPVFKLKSPPPEKDFNEAAAHAHHGGSSGTIPFVLVKRLYWIFCRNCVAA